MCGGSKLLIETYTHKLREVISTLQKKPGRQCSDIQLKNEAPEAKRYYIYQEPLLAPDYDD